MDKKIDVCEMCVSGRHSHCAGLRFTSTGIPFKPDPETGCACRECDRLKERWIYCNLCKIEIVARGLQFCVLCAILCALRAGSTVTQNLEAIHRFILGGMAIFTIVSKKSGERKTFRVRKAEDVDGSGRPHGFYVDLLIGPNNLEDYRYLGYVWIGPPRSPLKPPVKDYLHTKLNREGWANDAFTAFQWMIGAVNNRDLVRVQLNFEHMCEFHHAGFCSRCGRTLTDPESIEVGIGPVCRGRAA